MFALEPEGGGGMKAKARLFGHPIHQMLIVFPLGLLATSFFFDIAWLATKRPGLGIAAFWMILAGIIGGLAAAVFGLIDWLAVPSGTRAKSIGFWHGGGNVIIVALFFIAWLLRLNEPGNVPSTTPFILEIVGVLLALVTGWLGGELVDRLGVGVDRGANLDAPSSLSGGPAVRAGGIPPTTK